MKYKVRILDKVFVIKAPNASTARDMAARAYKPKAPDLQSLREIAEVKRV